MMHLDYLTRQGFDYERPCRIGFTILPVLPFLIGKEWDDLALAFVHSLRPSSIRVCAGPETTDSRDWRVTIHLRPGTMTIVDIYQEVEIGLLPHHRHAGEMEAEFKARGGRFPRP